MEHNGTLVIHGESFELSKVFPFRIAMVSDLQVGCIYGLAPRQFVDFNTQKIRKVELNEGQKLLLKYWDKFIEECNKNKVNYLWIPGDLIGGQNPIERGKYTMDIDLENQKEMAAEIIAYLVNKVPTIKEVRIWKGTPYHGSRDTAIESSIVDKLCKRGINALYCSEYSYITLEYNGKKKHLLITHPTSDTVMYPEASMGRDMRVYQERVAQGKLPPIHMIIRAHKHEFIEVHKSSIRALQLPSWQFFMPYDSAMKNYAQYQPDIGGVILMFDDKLRTQPFHFIYDNFIDPERFIRIGSKGVERKRLSKK